MRLYRTAIKVCASRLVQRGLTTVRRCCQAGFSNLLAFSNSASRWKPLPGKSAAFVRAYFESGDFCSRLIPAQSTATGFAQLECQLAD